MSSRVGEGAKTVALPAAPAKAETVTRRVSTLPRGSAGSTLQESFSSNPFAAVCAADFSVL
eukprot:4861620-Amphidinium_carterae.1